MKRLELGIDTSGPVLHLALRGEDGMLVERTGHSPHSHSEELPSLLQSALAESETSPRDLTRVVVGAGPGSFTGLRIGFGFAKGLAHALAIPLVEWCSFHAFAFEYRREGRLLTVVADARRQEFFVGVFVSDGVMVRALYGPTIVARDELKEMVEPWASEESGNGGGASVVVDFHSGYSPHAHGSLGPTTRVVVPNRTGAALLGVASGEAPNASLSETNPRYVRAVAALTIAERRRAAGEALR